MTPATSIAGMVSLTCRGERWAAQPEQPLDGITQGRKGDVAPRTRHEAECNIHQPVHPRYRLLLPSFLQLLLLLLTCSSHSELSSRHSSQDDRTHDGMMR